MPTDPAAPPLTTLDKLKAVIRDMRLEAREWEGINPINRRVARRLTTWADRLDLLLRESAQQKNDQGAALTAVVTESAIVPAPREVRGDEDTYVVEECSDDATFNWAVINAETRIVICRTWHRELAHDIANAYGCASVVTERRESSPLTPERSAQG